VNCVQLSFIKVRPEHFEQGMETLTALRHAHGDGLQKWRVTQLGPGFLACYGTWHNEGQRRAFAAALEQTVGGELAPNVLSSQHYAGDEAAVFRPSAAAPAFQRMVVIKVKPSRADEVIRAAEGSLPNVFSSRPGFVEYAMIRSGDDTGIFISSWKTKSQAQAEVLGSFSALKQLGPSAVLTIGKLLPAFISFDSYVGQVLAAEMPVESPPSPAT
jgi:hypothetical protein